MRGLLKNLQAWRSGYEANEIPEIILDPLGREWSLWDVERFYGYRDVLPDRMRLAIELMLYRNHYERDVARQMGISESNPVGVYVTVGLTRLLSMARSSELSGCHFEFEVDMVAPEPLAIPLVKYERGKQPRCGTEGCNHSLSFHGRARVRCRVTGCGCGQFLTSEMRAA